MRAFWAREALPSARLGTRTNSNVCYNLRRRIACQDKELFARSIAVQLIGPKRQPMNPQPKAIEEVTNQIELAISVEVGRHTTEKSWVTHYGANHIHPKHLVYWIVVRSDAEKQRLESNTALMSKLRSLLDQYEYPVEGRAGVHIGFESHETVNRESEGNFYHHWK